MKRRFLEDEIGDKMRSVNYFGPLIIMLNTWGNLPAAKAARRSSIPKVLATPIVSTANARC